MEDNIIDYGTWTVPSSYEEITLKQFQELTKYYSDKDKKFDVRDVMHILCNKTIDEVNALPMEFAEKILSKLIFLQEQPKYGEPTTNITIDGELYSINIMQKMKTGEYLSVDNILKSDSTNFAAILAVLCRKEGEIYDSTFEAEKFEKRVEMFEKIPMLEAMRVINFFIQRYIALETPSLLSSQLKETISLMRKDIENSVQNGEVSKRTMKSAMKTLNKLEKTINGI